VLRADVLTIICCNIPLAVVTNVFIALLHVENTTMAILVTCCCRQIIMAFFMMRALPRFTVVVGAIVLAYPFLPHAVRFVSACFWSRSGDFAIDVTMA
jgi:type II secretory pathway component PulF